MKKDATVDDVLYVFLKELHRDRLLHPDILQATRPDLLWEQAVEALDGQGFRVTSDIQQMTISRLYTENCVERSNLEDGSHLLQITEAGIAVLQSIEAAAADRRKEEREDFRWRVATYIAAASLVAAIAGFLIGWWFAES